MLTPLIPVSFQVLLIKTFFLTEISKKETKSTDRFYVITVIIIIRNHTGQLFHGNDKRKQYRTALMKRKKEIENFQVISHIQINKYIFLQQYFKNDRVILCISDK